MARQLSSSATYFYKRVFPVIWFGFVGLFLVGAIAGSIRYGTDHTATILVLTAMIAGGYLIMRIFVFDLADQVLDDGDALIVRNGNSEERIPLLNIINVSDSSFINPPRITLTLRDPCRWGREISFSPPRKFGFVLRSPIASELVDRIDVMRS